MAPQPSALEQCFEQVADSAPMALERCLNHVVTVLQDAECRCEQEAERVALGEAWRELLAHQSAWCQRYPQALRTAIRAAAAADARESAPAPAGHSRSMPHELALVDDVEIVRAIESSRLVRQVMPMVERPVSELDALVSSAMGLASVRPELNPVRPEVFAQGLRELMGSSQLKPATGSLWLKYMAEPLGEELQNLYGRLVTQLKDANVQPAGYRINAGAGQSRQAGAPAADAPGARSPVNYAGLASSRQISRVQLSDFLANGGGDEAQRALPDSYYAALEQELAALRAAEQQEMALPPPVPADYRATPTVERPQRPVDVQSALSPQVWGEYAKPHRRAVVRTQLRREALRVAQVLGLELVRRVVGRIAQDPRLLAPVREAIVALEPALLRLAMVDPRFFSDEQHPGRLLMERVARRSFSYNDEFSAEFLAFFEDVSSCFSRLNATPIQDTAPFEQGLAQLEAIWAELDRRQEEQRRQAVEALLFAERRQAEADHIAWELGSRTDLQDVPQVVQDFLFSRWTLVMAHARLTDRKGGIDPQGYIAVIADLLWSVKPEVTLKQPAQLFERVPRLLTTLRAGLASIGQEPDQNETFFQALEKLHRPVLKLRRAKSRRDARESGLAPLARLDPAAPASASAAAAAVSEPAHDQFWMSPRELDAAGFEETLPTGMAELEPDPGCSSPAPLTASAASPEQRAAAPSKLAQATPDGQSTVVSMREGDWFDLYSRQQWRRAQLIWASSKGSLFMFVSQGGQPHSMTRRICERLIRERYLRPVRMHGVVARALETLDEPARG